MVIIGLPGTEGRGQCRSLLSVHHDGKLVFHGSGTMAKGTRVVVDYGVLEVGEGFFCNCDSSFYCTRHISIGSEALLGWNVNMNTSNGHRVFDNGVHDTPNTLIAGMPAKDIKNNYSWKG